LHAARGSQGDRTRALRLRIVDRGHGEGRRAWPRAQRDAR
jgi:hypothetical protein